jgi:Uma2 family endonuclease
MGAQGTRLLDYHWVRDDAEEDLVGADWHQESIASLVNGLRRVARRAGQPWHVGNQLELVAWHPDATSWRPSPDVMVHPQAGAERRERMEAATDGVPALIIEVASKSTWHTDVGLDPRACNGAKAYEYLALGVAEYLVFDPKGDYVEGQCRGWRLRDGNREPWRPEEAGHYVSALGVAFMPEGLFLRLQTPDGRLVLLDHEVTDLEERAAIAEERTALLERQVAAQAQALATREQENAALRAELEQLRRRNNP